MSIGSFSVSITVYRQAAPTLTKGRYTPGAESVLNITGSVQPTKGDELIALPESLRQEGMFVIYTDTPLRTINQRTKEPADQVEINGSRYTVVFLESWQNNVINHYKAFVSESHD